MSRVLAYLVDPYLTEVDTVVTAVRHRGAVEVRLADTVFHPRSGGQPADTGAVHVGGRTLPVVDVLQDGAGTVWHAVEGDPPAPGEPATARIDWDRRYRLMRTHTAAHVIIGVVITRFSGGAVTGCDMGELVGRIDFDHVAATAAEIQLAVDEVLRRGAATSYELLPREEAMHDPDLVRTATNLVPPYVDPVRVVTIAGIDRQADGGTHVRTTDEIGAVVVRKIENKGSGLRRLRFGVLDA